MPALTLLLLFPALVAFALTMAVHRRFAPVQLRHSRGCRRMVRTFATGLLACSLFAAVKNSGWPVGAVLWFAALAATGFVITFALTYLPHQLPWLGLGSLLTAGLVALTAS